MRHLLIFCVLWAASGLASPLEILSDPSKPTSEKLEALKALTAAKANSAEYLDALRTVVMDAAGDGRVRAEAVEAWAKTSQRPAAIRFLLQALAQDPSERFQISGVSVLADQVTRSPAGRKKITEVYEALAKKQAYGAVQTLAVQQLDAATKYDKKIVSRLFEIFQTAKGETRAAAGAALQNADFNTPQFRAVLVANIGANGSGARADARLLVNTAWPDKSYVADLERLSKTVYDAEVKEVVERGLAREEYLNSKQAFSSACKAVCAILDHSERYLLPAYSHPKPMHPENTSNAAVMALQTLFMIKASRLCSTLPDEGYREISESSRKTAAAFLKVREDWSASTFYAKQFYLLLEKEAEAQGHPVNADLAESLAEDLKEALAAKQRGLGGSAFNTYGFAGVLATLDSPPAQSLVQLRKMVAQSKDKMALPYYPNRSNDSPRASATRNIPVYLALYRNSLNGEEARQMRSYLTESLENWIRYAPDHFKDQFRDETHLGKDGLAPYYFTPGTPYVGAAVFSLLADPNLTREERGRLEKIKADTLPLILRSVDKDGLALPMGGKHFESTSYSASPSYTNPLIGLALMPYASEEECGKNKPVLSLLHAYRESPQGLPRTGSAVPESHGTKK